MDSIVGQNCKQSHGEMNKNFMNDVLLSPRIGEFYQNWCRDNAEELDKIISNAEERVNKELRKLYKPEELPDDYLREFIDPTALFTNVLGMSLTPEKNEGNEVDVKKEVLEWIKNIDNRISTLSYVVLRLVKSQKYEYLAPKMRAKVEAASIAKLVGTDALSRTWWANENQEALKKIHKELIRKTIPGESFDETSINDALFLYSEGKLLDSDKIISELQELFTFSQQVILSPVALAPVQYNHVVSSDNEFCRNIFTEWKGDDGERCSIWLKGTSDKQKNRLQKAKIDFATYNTNELQIFDLDVLCTAMDVALQNKAPDGGWLVTLNQLYRAYFKVPPTEKILPAGMDLLKNSIHRLRNSGFSYLDLRDAADKGRIEVGLSFINGHKPFLDADQGLIPDGNPNKDKQKHTAGFQIKTIPPLYEFTKSLCRLRNVMAHMRVPNWSRNESVESQFIFILNRLLMSIGGRTANNCTIYLVDEDEEGLLRKTATKKDRERTSERVEKLIHHWVQLNVCQAEIEYVTYRGKNTKTIKKFRLFKINPENVIETKKIKLLN